MKPQVRWTSREWERLAQYFIDAGIDPDKFGFSRSLGDAQKKMLPAERHRNVKGIPAQLKKKLKEHTMALEYKIAFATPYPPLDPKPPIAESLSTEDLLVELARRIAKLFEPAKPNPVDRAYFPPPTAKEQGVATPCRKRILIVGPRAEQQQALKHKHPTVLLRFVTLEEGDRLIAERSVSCEEIILWTKFMTHSQQTAAKNTEVRTWFANTMQQIEERLTTWATT